MGTAGRSEHHRDAHSLDRARPVAATFVRNVATMAAVESCTLLPREVFEELRKGVVGQDDVLREIAVAVVKHLVGHPAPNILLIGNSGSGKTTLMRAVEQFLAGRPDLFQYANLVRINANVLAEERQGYGRSVLSRLYANARKIFGPDAPAEVLLHSVERGMIFIDEVDKIRAEVKGQPNVRGIVGQEALLTLMENENGD